MSGALRPALVGVALAAAGCFSDSLAETTGGSAASAGSTSTSGTATSTSTSTATDASSTTTTSTADPSTTTGAESTTTGEPSTTAVTSTTTTSASTTSTTTGPPIETVVVLPKLAVCTFLAGNGAPYGAPLECTNAATNANATQATGVLTVDTTTNYALGREAQIFLLFAIPEDVDPEAATFTLTIHTADNENAGGTAGELHLAEAFSSESLTTAAPALLALLTANIELLAANDAATWLVPSDVVTPGQPLYLGLKALSDNGVFYLGDPADLAKAPSLTIESK